MFYCDPCAESHGYPRSFGKSLGSCELCSRPAACNDIPSWRLPKITDRPGPALDDHEPSPPRAALQDPQPTDNVSKIIRLCGVVESSGLRGALLKILMDVHTRAYDLGHADGYEQRHKDDEKHLYACQGCHLCDGPPCPYTHSHTRSWCGHSDCRES